jgi:hypothetical protein
MNALAQLQSAVVVDAPQARDFQQCWREFPREPRREDHVGFQPAQQSRQPGHMAGDQHIQVAAGAGDDAVVVFVRPTACSWRGDDQSHLLAHRFQRFHESIDKRRWLVREKDDAQRR